MNRFLLVWNLVLTVVLIALVIGGCTALDPQLAALPGEVQTNRSLIEQLVNQANDNRQLINANQAAITKNTLVIAQMQQTTQAAVAQLQNSLQQYVQSFVQQALAQQ